MADRLVVVVFVDRVDAVLLVFLGMAARTEMRLVPFLHLRITMAFDLEIP